MSTKVFVLGAGFNQFIKKNFGSLDSKAVKKLGFGDVNLKSISLDLAPPMSKNYFRYSLIRQLYEGESLYGINEIVLNYIERFFNRPRAILLSEEFDLELLFTFITAQINEAIRNHNEKGKMFWMLSFTFCINLSEFLILNVNNYFF